MIRQPLNNLEDAELALRPYVKLVAQLTGLNEVLVRIKPLMDQLGNPQNRLKVIHIAGTSGKTSTAYYLSELLTLTGKNVGLTVSPHVDLITERVQINNQPLSEAEFCNYLTDFLGVVDSCGVKLSYFELLYAFAFFVFDVKKVDYAVVETGMGGLYDATNIATAKNKLCLITDIGFDHMKILGSTLPEITAQKAGIIHKSNYVICYRQAPAIMKVIKERVASELASLEEIDDRALAGYSKFQPDLPDYQRRNWFLAYQAYHYLASRERLTNLKERQLLTSQTIQVPARMDVSHYGDKVIVMDGAHNGQKMETFIASFKKRFRNIRPLIVLSVKDSKQIDPIIKPLTDIASRITLTTFTSSEDLPSQAVSPELLKKALSRLKPGLSIQVRADPVDAVRQALKGDNPTIVFTGSFYFVSEVRRILARTLN